MIQRTKVIDIHPTPEEIAFEFANMGDEKQARFFNHLAKITSNWDRPLCFQLSAIINNPVLTEAGKKIMEAIGEYGEDE